MVRGLGRAGGGVKSWCCTVPWGKQTSCLWVGLCQGHLLGSAVSPSPATPPGREMPCDPACGLPAGDLLAEGELVAGPMRVMSSQPHPRGPLFHRASFLPQRGLASPLLTCRSPPGLQGQLQSESVLMETQLQ